MGEARDYPFLDPSLWAAEGSSDQRKNQQKTGARETSRALVGQTTTIPGLRTRPAAKARRTFLSTPLGFYGRPNC